MKVKLAYNLLLGFLFLFVSCQASLIQDDYSKTIKREFQISPNGTTSISNKYGKVSIKTWDQNKVKINVTIIVKASSEKDANEVFDRIDVDFSNGDSYVKAATNIQPQKKSWWKMKRNEVDYTINYDIYMPSSNNLDLLHKYGDVYIADLEGTANINVKYSSLKIESVGDDSGITIAHGNGSLVTGKDINMNVSYGDFYVKELRDAEINSKYATLELNKAEEVKCNTMYDNYRIERVANFKNIGKYDNIRIKDVNNVSVNSKYTQLAIESVNKEITLNFQHGKANCTISEQCKAISLLGNYADFAMTISPGLSTAVEVMANYANINYPNEMNVSYEKRQKNTHEIKGNIGSNPASKLSATLDYGKLKIYYR